MPAGKSEHLDSKSGIKNAIKKNGGDIDPSVLF